MSPGFNRLLAGGAFSIFALAGASAFAAQPAKVVKDERIVIERAGPGGQRQVIVRKGAGPGHPGVFIQQGDGDQRHVIMIRHGGPMQADKLRALLQLKPAQEGALKAYLEALEPPDHDAFIKLDGPGGDQTTLERLAAEERRLDEHTARAKARLNATRTFYAQLETPQQKAFDEMPMLMEAGPMPFGPIPVASRMMMHMPMAMPMPFEDGFDMPAPPAPPKPPKPPRAPAPPPPPQ